MKTWSFSVLFLAVLFEIEGRSVPCDLTWVSEGYGNIPAFSIESGSSEYVGRAFHVNKWISGRVSPSKGKIFTTFAGAAFEYDTYEVLTNPDNCLLEWVDGYGGSSPSEAVSVNKITDPTVYIGRGVIAGLTLGGRVVIDESVIYISYDGKEEARRSYQILRSFYPPLKVRLSHFIFQINDLKNSTELIGQEDIRNSFNMEIHQTIDHGKVIQERFTLTEPNNWEGFQNVQFTFPLWYGSSDVTGEFELDPSDPEISELTINRDREVRIRRDLDIKAASGTSSNHIQVCSTVSIVEDLISPIQFTARAVYEAENMSKVQVEKILEGLGRPVSSTKAHRRNAVSGSFTGALNGRFAIHFSSYTGVVDWNNGVCAGYAKQIPDS